MIDMVHAKDQVSIATEQIKLNVLIAKPQFVGGSIADRYFYWLLEVLRR